MKQKETEIICGLYSRVSTEDQSRFGHSLNEQEDRLQKLCEFKDYKIYKVFVKKMYLQKIPINRNFKR